LYEAREKYVAWEAFALWVRAIEETEGDFPEWLGKAVEKRCRGFLKFVARTRLGSIPVIRPSFGITWSAGLTSASSPRPGGKAG